MAHDRSDEKPSRGESAEESSPDQETTQKLVEVDDSSMQRFKPDTAPADSITLPAWEPGVVEVVFKNETRPEMAPQADAASPPVMSSANADLSGLNQILQQRNLERAEPTFKSGSFLPDEAAPPEAAQPTAGKTSLLFTFLMTPMLFR